MALEDALVSKLGLSAADAQRVRKQFGANALSFLVSSPFGKLFDYLWFEPASSRISPTRKEPVLLNYAELMVAVSKGDSRRVQTAARQVAGKLETLSRTGAGTTLTSQQRKEYRSWGLRLRAIANDPAPLLDAVTTLREMEPVRRAARESLINKISLKKKFRKLEIPPKYPKFLEKNTHPFKRRLK